MQKWTEEISANHSLFDFKLGEVWKYRDLLALMIRRNFVANYKQTVLGPLWFFINPIFTSLMFNVVFGNIAGISTDGIPGILFYLSGLTLWNYFQDCLTGTSYVFRDNASIFGKVYFPRLVMPLSIIIGNLLRFGIQFLLFIIFLIYFLIKGVQININVYALLLPFLLILMAGLSLGFGLIICSMTTKYRDLSYLLSFGVSLLMYATPIIYPISIIYKKLPEKFHFLAMINPISPIIEAFKHGFLGEGILSWGGLLYSTIFTFFSIFIGIIIFNKVERSFMDTV
ncbi:ABC transporter permease [Apibacter sp. B2912]|uniref:ABC transporter permease n=1 Tax=Apibacter sp. B2912 TaxID=2656763 RepID=UPI002106F724|nr:ABC transporter permease [Apibacter sp. B2912]